MVKFTLEFVIDRRNGGPEMILEGPVYSIPHKENKYQDRDRQPYHVSNTDYLYT